MHLRACSAMPCQVMAAACVQSSCRRAASPIMITPLPFDPKPPLADHRGRLRPLDPDPLWRRIQDEARADAEGEPLLRLHYHHLVLSHATLESALAAHLGAKLAVPGLIPGGALRELFSAALAEDAEIRQAVRADLRAAGDRDPACAKLVHCFLYCKGFLALQAHRVAHRLWTVGRRSVALMLQSRASEAFAVDIHPGARIGAGVLLDHATGVVIGETAVVGDGVSILHGVTLGGTGKEGGDRHPKIGDGVLIGAGTQVLGNVSVGNGAKIGAGAVVLRAVPAGTTAVGSPARVVRGAPLGRRAGLTMDHAAWPEDGARRRTWSFIT